MSDELYTFTEEDGGFLVKTARKAIIEVIENKNKLSPPHNTPNSLYEKFGVFVTLNRREGHQLRGCIGYPLPIKPLIEATIEVAIQAATQDPRFPSVQLYEAENEILVEVSVLTKPTVIKVDNPADYPKHVHIGEDGLIVECGYNSGLLLPQVATEWEMDSEEFLSHCCLKAGLPPDNWLTKDIKVKKFKAEIFSEEEPNGQIRRKSIRKSMDHEDLFNAKRSRPRTRQKD
ncbi:TIGR00296 family protein [[Eubacterium] cellulosolvens]